MTASGPQILVKRDRSGLDPISLTAPKTAWRYLGWLGLLLAVVGGVDIATRWYPTSFKSPEWEFGTVAVTIGTLPLFTIGVVAMMVSFLARGAKSGIRAMAGVFVVLSLFVAGSLTIFLLDVPFALRVVAPSVGLELRKTILRTLVMGVAFEAMFIGSAVLSFRYLFRRVKDV